MPSTLGYALLGLLARRPQTGYELTQALRAPIGHFWSTTHSQVYPELARLEAGGLVRHRVIEGPGPRDTKRYTITAQGRRALAEWAVQPANPAPSREEFLLKVYSMWTVAPARAHAATIVELERHRAALAGYERIEAEMRHEHGPALFDPSTPQFSAYATLRRGVSFERHVIAWCEWLLEVLGAASPGH